MKKYWILLHGSMIECHHFLSCTAVRAHMGRCTIQWLSTQTGLDLNGLLFPAFSLIFCVNWGKWLSSKLSRLDCRVNQIQECLPWLHSQRRFQMKHPIPPRQEKERGERHESVRARNYLMTVLVCSQNCCHDSQMPGPTAEYSGKFLGHLSQCTLHCEVFEWLH